MHVKCPEIQGAGIAIAGVPGIIAGYNGNVAYGMTMVMADNQDLFLEKLKTGTGRTLLPLQRSVAQSNKQTGNISHQGTEGCYPNHIRNQAWRTVKRHSER